MKSKISKHFLFKILPIFLFVLLFYLKDVYAERGSPSCSEFGMEEYYKNLTADIVKTFPGVELDCNCVNECNYAYLTLSGELFLNGKYNYQVFIYATRDGNISVGPKPFDSFESLKKYITQLEETKVVNKLINQYNTSKTDYSIGVSVESKGEGSVKYIHDGPSPVYPGHYYLEFIYYDGLFRPFLNDFCLPLDAIDSSFGEMFNKTESIKNIEIVHDYMKSRSDLIVCVKRLQYWGHPLMIYPKGNTNDGLIFNFYSDKNSNERVGVNYLSKEIKIGDICGTGPLICKNQKSYNSGGHYPFLYKVPAETLVSLPIPEDELGNFSLIESFSENVPIPEEPIIHDIAEESKIRNIKIVIIMIVIILLILVSVILLKKRTFKN